MKWNEVFGFWLKLIIIEGLIRGTLAVMGSRPQ